MESYISLIGLAWFANLFCWRFDLSYWVDFKDKYLDYYIFRCTTCFGFWFGLICTFDIYHALFISVLSALFEKYLMVWND